MKMLSMFAIMLALPAALVAQVTVSNPTVRETTPQQKLAVATATILNGETPDMLVSATSPASSSIMLHQVIRTNGRARMVHLPGGVPLPPHSRVDLKASGYHVMLTGLNRQLKAGEKVPVTLNFQSGRKDTQYFQVVSIR